MALPCPCCGYLTMEDDNVQYNDPSYEGGANGVSLNQARLNYKKFGAAKERPIGYVREPSPNEIPPGHWEANKKEK